MSDRRVPPRPVRRTRRRLSGDRGAGLISTFAGLLAFLAFLLFACQLLLGLFARSTTSAAAYDGARFVAEHGRLAPADRAAVEAEGAARVRQLLGAAGTGATLDWSGTDDEWVQLHVTLPAPRLGWPGLGVGPATIERGARVRVEDLR